MKMECLKKASACSMKYVLLQTPLPCFPLFSGPPIHVPANIHIPHKAVFTTGSFRSQ